MRRCRVPISVLLAFPLVLVAACTRRDPIVSTASAVPVGNWRIERQTDRITGAPLSSAFVTAPASNSSADFPHPAMMQISCFKDQPIVRFGFEFKVGANKNSLLGIRFDDKPGREPEARFLQNAMVVVLEDKAVVTEFLKDLVTSKSLYVRIRSLNSGRTAAEFRLEGSAAAIAEALPACYSPGEEPQRTAAASPSTK